MKLATAMRRRAKTRRLVEGLRIVGPALCVLVMTLVLVQLADSSAGIDGRAREARALALREGFRSAVRMVHVGWIANGRATPVRMADGTAIAVNAEGWPALGVAGQHDVGELYARLFPESVGRARSDGATAVVYEGVSLSYDERTGLVR